MRKKWGKRLLSLTLAATMMTSLALTGCSSKEKKNENVATEKADDATQESNSANDTSSEENSTDTVVTDGEYAFTEGITLDSAGTVNVFGFSEGQNYEKVIDKFEEVTKDTLKTDLNFQWASDIKTEQPLQLAAQGDIDLMFDASWLNSGNNISQGMYKDLSKYFLNPDYPGLYKAFPEEIVEAMKNPADGCIYGIPYFIDYNSLRTIFIRGDWREKLGCEPVVDDETLLAYLEAVDKNKEELGAVSAAGLGNRGWYYFHDNTCDLQSNNIFEIQSTGARVTQNAYVLLNGDNSAVEDIMYVGDPDEGFTNWPSGKNVLNSKAIEFGTKWSQYVNEDAASGGADQDKFAAGLYGVMEGDLSSYLDLQRKLTTNNKDAKLEYYIYDEPVRNKEKGEVYMNMSIANNYMYVPYFNDDPDRAMAVVDWIFQCQANNDLFSLGIEGEDFERVGESQYVSLNPDNKYVFPSWLWSNNPLYCRYDSETPEDIMNYRLWASDSSNFKENPLSGFSFSTQNVSTEFAAFNSIQQDYYSLFMIGTFGDKTEEKLNEFYEKTKDYTTVIKDDLKKQIETYFSNKK